MKNRKLHAIGPEVAPTVDGEDSHTQPGWGTNLLRPKGNLSKAELYLLGLLALAPLAMVMIRVSALPGVVDPGPDGTQLDFIRTLGNALNQTLSLSYIPPEDRERTLYLLFLPTCAVLIALTRITFGIRVMGFRSILIAVGFQQSGIVPSLILILVVVATILLVRPHLKRFRLPKFVRVLIILCIVAVTLVAALLAGPWLRSPMIWNVAFFPVVVLGLLAEGFARSLDRDNPLTAAWRTGTTIVLAFLIAMLCQVGALRETLLQFPELVIPQIVAIVMIYEFLDFNLFQEWDAKLSGMALPRLFADDSVYRVAVVRNRSNAGIIAKLGRATPKRYGRRSVQRVVDALREGGHTVKVFEGDMDLLSELRDFLPPNAKTGQPGGIVFNLAHGIQGDARDTHVPAMLEMSGIPYTGATPLGHALALDKVVAKTLMQRAGVPTPAFAVQVNPDEEPHGLFYPLMVKPRHESNTRPRVVQDPRELQNAVANVVRRYRQEAIVEEYIDGREINVSLLGNDPVECMPLVELHPETREKMCPAPIDEELAERIRECAMATFWACGCRDYARINIRIGKLGHPYVLGLKSIGILARRGSFAQAAAQAGYSFSDLMRRIIEVARERYMMGGVIRPLEAAPKSHSPAGASAK